MYTGDGLGDRSVQYTERIRLTEQWRHTWSGIQCAAFGQNSSSMARQSCTGIYRNRHSWDTNQTGGQNPWKSNIPAMRVVTKMHVKVRAGKKKMVRMHRAHALLSPVMSWINAIFWMSPCLSFDIVCVSLLWIFYCITAYGHWCNGWLDTRCTTQAGFQPIAVHVKRQKDLRTTGQRHLYLITIINCICVAQWPLSHCAAQMQLFVEK